MERLPGCLQPVSLNRRQLLMLGSAAAALAWHPPLALSGATPEATPAANDFAGLVDIGGRSLFLESRGIGEPTVILEAGAGNNGQIWDTVALPEGTMGPAVFPGVAAFTHTVVYDRPNTYRDAGFPGRSDPMPGRRTASDMVADLHALLAAAGIAPPYVLAGHSFGGLIVRLYASTYPGEVVGMVLVDAAQEDYYAAVMDLLTPAQQEEYTQPQDIPGYPDLETIDTVASAEEMRVAAGASPLRAMPMVVLTHGRPWDYPPDYPAAALEDLWLPLQRKLAALVPDSRLVIAEESQHYIHHTQPDLVVEAIRQVVDAVRDPNTWTTS
jgi:pimeloyl-ACP methyl ester carboxylesterase